MNRPLTWETSCPNIAKALALLNDPRSSDDVKRTVEAARGEMLAAFSDNARGLSPGELQAIAQLSAFGSTGLLALRNEEAERNKNPKLQSLAEVSRRRANELETLLRRINAILQQWKTTT